MEPHLIDAQFDRAVEIIQSLPKTGPIQTGYEEKLAMYSLYKQATVGNVTTSRPQIWDMLGRAKWDEWAKHKDMNQYEAKWLYVDALLKVLKKYSDRTVARDLVLELESYGVDSSSMAKSRVPIKSQGSTSSGSTTSDDDAIRPTYPLMTPPNDILASSHQPIANPAEQPAFDEETDEEARGYQVVTEPGQTRRPQSSRSSHRYRTPMAGSLAMSPSAAIELASVPPTQPHPGFETPSAFAETTSSSIPSSLFPTSSYAEQYSQSSRPEVGPEQHIYDRRYRHPLPSSSQQYGSALLASQPPIEHAMERIQGHLAALTERLELLETHTRHYQRSSASLATGGSTPNRAGIGRLSPADSPNRPVWDFDDLGMWSLLLNPLMRGINSLRTLADFFARNENRSPMFVVVRRLFLDVSFLLCVATVMRVIWRKSGVRRREVRAALRILWHALLGRRKERVMVDRGV